MLRNGSHYVHMLGNDILGTDSRQRSTSTDEQICESYERIVYPRMMKNRNNDWLFVVNQPRFSQGVRIEYCL